MLVQLWTKQIGSSSYDVGRSVAVDSQGNVYVTGYTNGTLPGQTSAGEHDIFLIKYPGDGGPALWTKQFGTTDSDDVGLGVAVDSEDNVYVTGYTFGTLPGQTSANAGDSDIFLIKYPGDGGPALWTKQIGSTEVDHSRGVAVDSSGNVYVTGTTDGTLPGQSAKERRNNDIFLIKYPGDGGAPLWTKQIVSTNSEESFGVAVDSKGNVYVTGFLGGTLPGQTSAGIFDIFLIKYPGNGGDALWTKQIGSSSYDYGNSVAVDSEDNVYVTGFTTDTLPGQTSAGGHDIFLIKYPGDGGPALWTKQIGSTSYDESYSVTVDSEDNVYVTGHTYGTLPGQTFANAGGYDIFLIKYPGDGKDALWTKQIGTAARESSYSVAVDSQGNVYVTGITYGTLPGQTSAGEGDIFLIKFGKTSQNYDVETHNILYFREGTTFITCLDPQTKREYECAVELMAPGLFVKTYKHGYIQVQKMTSKTVQNPDHQERIENRLYTCSVSDYPELYRDLYITGCHSILESKISDEQIQAIRKVLGHVYYTDDKIRLIAMCDDRAKPFCEAAEFKVWHVCLEHFDDEMNYGIYANGLQVESCSKRNLELGGGTTFPQTPIYGGT